MVNGQEVNVPFKDLKVADDSVVELMATSDKNCAEVLAKDFGTTSFSYEKDGVVYEMEANVILPDVGFYTSASADKDSYIGMDAFAVTDTVKTVYMVAAGDWKFVTVEPNMNFKNVATYTINNAKNVVTITFFDSPNSDFWYDISYEIEIENESVMRGGNCHIHLLDKTTRLAFGEPGLEAGETGEFDTIWYTACGYMNDVEFYLVQGNTVVQKVSTDDLKVADDTILSVTEENLFESTDKITHMKAIGWGETEIQYVNAGNTYRVSVISELQRVGFYKDAQISQNNWFTGPLVATDKNNVVYLMAMDGYVFSNVKAGEACADYVDIKLSNNRDCVTVTINEYYEDFWLQIDVDVMSESCECDIDCNDGSGCMSDCWCNYCRPVSSSFGMEVQAGLCRHENTSIINAVDATCTETGYTGDTKCLDCGEIIKTGETYAAYGHSFKTIVTAPTCTEKGYTTHICEVCEYTYKDAEVDALGHDIEVKNAKAASCTEAGYTGDEVCEVCETVVTKGEVIEKLGHDTEVKDAKAATCTEAGYTGDEVCKVCETVVTKGEVIAKLGHDTEVKDAKAATCTTSGYTGDTVCKVCETVVEKGTIISAKGHTYENMVCTVCGDKMMVVEKVEDVDTSVPVEVVTPVVNQNAVDTATKETTKVIEAILAENVTEEIKAAVSEETIEAIKQAVEAGAQIAANIISNVVTEEQAVKEDVEEIKENIGETGTVAQYLDLSIMIKAVVANGEEVQLGTLNELTETITFPIIIPAELIQAGREFYVVRVHNGVADRLEVTKHMDGSYSFETDRFSTYALVYEDHALTEDKSPITSDMFMWICSVAIVAGCGVFVFSKKGKAIR